MTSTDTDVATATVTTSERQTASGPGSIRYEQSRVATVKPGTLIATGSGGTIAVDLPHMNRSWRTGDFWLTAASTVISGLVLMAPIIEPQLDVLGQSRWLATIPMGLGPVVYAIARQWYKGARMKYAAELATKSLAQQRP